ncbi:MAG: 30S ribosomal protein S8e [Methanobacteriaceae archaeon]|jgi:small subunit ribosomal protein S8e|nr:30S ribosomal protein S8e [Methanobacteriaceae archaeon]MDO9045177.1 30S ribosomal protein S8e [Methanobacteriaceae archaeon]MDO9626305.1 30S ribosomal protein S8e [Methanobacteriaceae archaeon]MDP2837407.1 30S ribosomal protein S8e [Methanobacteriaceae archaeon]MDP3035099.1 30S ribosomal protein S8e [Methanobacteriaceae archaeon]
MAIWQGKSMKKPSGGRAKMNRGKKKCELGREAAETKIGDRKIRRIRTQGGNEKIRLSNDSKINVMNPSTKKSETAEILNVVENLANPNFVRRNIITKGALVETSAGKVRVTSRPGQHGIINGVLIAE